eukprot:6190852-Pleurochrysis_carterae.AAC.3
MTADWLQLVLGWAREMPSITRLFVWESLNLFCAIPLSRWRATGPTIAYSFAATNELFSSRLDQPIPMTFYYFHTRAALDAPPRPEPSRLFNLSAEAGLSAAFVLNISSNHWHYRCAARASQTFFLKFKLFFVRPLPAARVAVTVATMRRHALGSECKVVSNIEDAAMTPRPRPRNESCALRLLSASEFHCVTVRCWRGGSRYPLLLPNMQAAGTLPIWTIAAMM